MRASTLPVRRQRKEAAEQFGTSAALALGRHVNAATAIPTATATAEIHVSTANGDDAAQPLKTISAAAERANSALIGLARGQAMELAPLNIRVNSVSPGTVDSPMRTRYIADCGEDPVALRASFDANHPRGKVASIDDVANAFVFLASDLSANITAQDLRCDGGFSFKGGQAAV
jgi:NAD(P)-dependent dehydrogenase (short-subunit alcohol dehydrogenase family)